MAIGAIACPSSILLLDLGVELSKLHLLSTLHLGHQHGHLLVALLKLGLGDAKLFIDPGYLTLLLVEDALKLLFQLLLILLEVIGYLKSQFLFLLFEFLDFFIKDFDMELKLLLDLNVVSNLSLVLLELLLVLLWWEIDALESAGKPCIV